MDTLTPTERSRRMSLVRCKDTRPEMVVRRLVHRMGYRYRLHDKRLAGAPDLVFRRHRRIIFIHGCFWHQHSCASGNRMPKSRVEFWTAKLTGNVARDRRATRELRRKGWRVLTVWECETRDPAKMEKKLARFFSC